MLVDVLALATVAKHQPANNGSGMELRLFDWSNDDPLRYVLLALFGAYPDPAKGYPDYATLLTRVFRSMKRELGVDDSIPSDAMLALSPVALSARHLKWFKLNQCMGNCPGLYVGSCRTFTDIVCFWNLRAAGIELAFFDPEQASGMGEYRDTWLRALDSRPVTNHIPQLTNSVSVLCGDGKLSKDLGASPAYPWPQRVDEFTFAPWMLNLAMCSAPNNWC